MVVKGERRNNPGCISPCNDVATYATLEDGYLALNELLLYSGRYTNKSAYGIFSVYAPESDGNDPHAYAKSVATRLSERLGTQIDPYNTILDLQNPLVLAELTKAISIVECEKVLGGEEFADACSRKFVENQMIHVKPICTDSSLDIGVAACDNPAIANCTSRVSYATNRKIASQGNSTFQQNSAFQQNNAFQENSALQEEERRRREQALAVQEHQQRLQAEQIKEQEQNAQNTGFSKKDVASLLVGTLVSVACKGNENASALANLVLQNAGELIPDNLFESDNSQKALTNKIKDNSKIS